MPFLEADESVARPVERMEFAWLSLSIDKRNVRHTLPMAVMAAPEPKLLYLQVIVPADGTSVVSKNSGPSAPGRSITTRGHFRIRTREHRPHTAPHLASAQGNNVRQDELVEIGATRAQRTNSVDFRLGHLATAR